MEEPESSKRCMQLMESGRKLFWKYGFRRVSVDEICTEAGVSKMTFYRCYSNKTDLARKIYIKIIDEGTRRFREIMGSDAEPEWILEQVLLLKLEGTNEISREFLTDFYAANESGMKEFVEQTTARVWSEIIEIFREAQSRGIFRNDFNPEFLLLLTQHLIPVMTDNRALDMYGTPQDLVMELARFFTWGIAPHK